jgi:hypothetical protein
MDEQRFKRIDDFIAPFRVKPGSTGEGCRGADDLIGILDPSRFFPTIESAMEAFVEHHGASVGVRPSQSEVRTPL